MRNEKRVHKKRNWKKVFAIAAPVVILAFFLISFCVDWYIYGTHFERAELLDPALYGGYYYEDFAEQLDRREVRFLSGENQLTGYLYGEENRKGILVFAHGIGGSADSYFVQEKHFLDEGYAVFAYDCTGSGRSEGKSMNGFPQALRDLDAALTWLESQDGLNELPVLLMGHSWGGYAVAAVLNLEHEVTAVVSVAGVNGAYEIVDSWAVDMLGKFAYTQFPTLNLVQFVKFKGDAGLTAVEGINKSGIPVLIIHGKEDTVVGYDGPSIISHKGEITNPNVSYFVTEGEQGGHNSLFWSKEALAYMDEANQEYEKLYDLYENEPPYEKRVEYIDTLDDAQMSELNEEVFAQIDEFLENALR